MQYNITLVHNGMSECKEMCYFLDISGGEL